MHRSNLIEKDELYLLSLYPLNSDMLLGLLKQLLSCIFDEHEPQTTHLRIAKYVDLSTACYMTGINCNV